MTTNVYRSRSRTTRTRLLIAAAVVALVMLGFGIGRLAGNDPPAEATAAPPSTAPATTESPEPAPPPAESPSPSAPTGGVDAYQRIEVESAAEVNGLEFEDTGDEGGGKNAGWINNDDWMRFENINFGGEPPSQLNVRVASESAEDANGRLEIRLNDPASPPLATLKISHTGGWQNWRTEATETAGSATGLHTVYITFASDKGDDFVNINWLTFRR